MNHNRERAHTQRISERCTFQPLDWSSRKVSSISKRNPYSSKVLRLVFSSLTIAQNSPLTLLRPKMRCTGPYSCSLCSLTEVKAQGFTPLEMEVFELTPTFARAPNPSVFLQSNAIVPTPRKIPDQTGQPWSKLPRKCIVIIQKFGWAAVLTPKLSAYTLDLVYGCPVWSNFIGAPLAGQCPHQVRVDKAPVCQQHHLYPFGQSLDGLFQHLSIIAPRHRGTRVFHHSPDHR